MQQIEHVRDLDELQAIDVGRLLQYHRHEIHLLQDSKGSHRAFHLVAVAQRSHHFVKLIRDAFSGHFVLQQASNFQSSRGYFQQIL
jgi:hypothetical protein